MLSSVAFDNIDRLASANSTRLWAAEEEHAKRECICDVTVMDIYVVLPRLSPAWLRSAQHQLIQIGTSGAEPDHGLLLERLQVVRIWVIPFKDSSTYD